MQYNLVSEIVQNRGGSKTDRATVQETMAAAVVSGALITSVQGFVTPACLDPHLHALWCACLCARVCVRARACMVHVCVCARACAHVYACTIMDPTMHCPSCPYIMDPTMHCPSCPFCPLTCHAQLPSPRQYASCGAKNVLAMHIPTRLQDSKKNRSNHSNVCVQGARDADGGDQSPAAGPV